MSNSSVCSNSSRATRSRSVKFEAFKEKQRETLASIFSFLDLEPLRSVRSKDRNVVPYERAMNWEEKVFLYNLFAGRHRKARAAIELGLLRLEIVAALAVGNLASRSWPLPRRASSYNNFQSSRAICLNRGR